MEFKMGNISVKCKCCQTVTVIDDNALYKMKAFRCPGCDTEMSKYEFAGIMMRLNCMVYEKIHGILGDAKKQFEYDINIFPHYEVNETEQKETD